MFIGKTQIIQEMDSGEKRLNELGYKQELRREMVFSFSFLCFCFFLFFWVFWSWLCLKIITLLLQTLFKTFAISFSTMTLFTGITPLYGSSLLYAGPASLVWGWVVVSFFTWFVGLAMAEICSSFPVCLSLSLSFHHFHLSCYFLFFWNSKTTLVVWWNVSGVFIGLRNGHIVFLFEQLYSDKIQLARYKKRV